MLAFMVHVHFCKIIIFIAAVVSFVYNDSYFLFIVNFLQTGSGRRCSSWSSLTWTTRNSTSSRSYSWYGAGIKSKGGVGERRVNTSYVPAGCICMVTLSHAIL